MLPKHSIRILLLLDSIIYIVNFQVQVKEKRLLINFSPLFSYSRWQLKYVSVSLDYNRKHTYSFEDVFIKLQREDCMQYAESS